MTVEPLFARYRERLLRCTSLPEVFAERGLTLEQVKGFELGLDEDGNGVIAQRDLGGRLLGLKVRLLDSKTYKYLEIPFANGNPPWFPSDVHCWLTQPPLGVLCVEGELNAMVTSLALEGHGWAVIGLGSAFGPVPWEWLRALRVPVIFSLDRGRAGDKSTRAWLAQAKEVDVGAHRAEPLLADWDACEYAHVCGLEALTTRWLQILRKPHL